MLASGSPLEARLLRRHSGRPLMWRRKRHAKGGPAVAALGEPGHDGGDEEGPVQAGRIAMPRNSKHGKAGTGRGWYSCRRGERMPSSDSTPEGYRKRINRVIFHIEAHLGEPLRLDDLARVAHFSPFHFHRIFAAFTGESLASDACDSSGQPSNCSTSTTPSPRSPWAPATRHPRPSRVPSPPTSASTRPNTASDTSPLACSARGHSRRPRRRRN